MKKSVLNDVKASPAEVDLKDNSASLSSLIGPIKKVKKSGVNDVKDSPADIDLKENPIGHRTKKMKKSVVNDVASFEEMDCIPVKHSLVKDEAITVEEAIASVKSHGPTDNAGCFKPKGKTKRETIIADEPINLENVYDGALNPRRNPSRQNHCKATDLFKKQEGQIHKSSHTTPSISDEELARQLHRAMNSSPRISRCLSQNLKLSLL